MKNILRLLLLLFVCSLAWGQNPGNQPITPEAAVTDNFGVDSINLQNLSVNVDLPVVNKAGAIPFSYTLSGVSNCAKIPSSTLGQYYAGCGIGFQKTYGSSAFTNFNLEGLSPVSGWALQSASNTGGTCSYGSTRTYKGLSVYTPDGETLYLPASDSYTTGPSQCESGFTDVTLSGGVTVTAQPGNPADGFTLADGEVPLQGGGQITDTFSNSISSSINGYQTKYTDTLGTIVLTSNLPTATTAGSYVYTDTSGNSQTIQEQYTSQTSVTNFGCSNVTDVSPVAVNMLSEVEYPDGNNFYFTYEPISGGTTGRISQLTLRTGGTINYSYGTINCGAFIPATLSRTTQDGTTTYAWAIFGSGPVWGSTTTILDPGKNKRVYTFMGTSSSGLPLQATPIVLTELQVYQNTGTVSSPVYALVTQDIYCYNGNQTNCPTATSTVYPITQKDSYHYVGSTSLEMNHNTKTFDTYGNVTSSSTYDYISGQTVTVNTTYGSWVHSACHAIGSGVINKPCDVKTTDGAGHTLAESLYTYSSQGFNTQTQKWNGSTWLTSSATPNANGTPATTTDINGAITTLSYANGCNNLLLTGTSVTPTSGDTLTTSQTWDCNTALPLIFTDPNGNQASKTYDSMLRLASATDMDGFAVSTSYPTGNTIVGSWTMTNGDSSSTTTTLDGLGRSILSQTTDGSEYDTTSTSYGWNGTTFRVGGAQPCLVASGAGCTITAYQYFDPLGRTTSATNGNGGTVTYAYSKNDVQVTAGPAPSGEHTKVVQTEIDGLGRATSVCGLEASGGTACGQADGGSGILTTAIYSFGSGSSTVSSTRGSQTHTATSDALGRPTSVTTPESGTTTNVYDSTSDGVCTQASAGDLVESTPADGIKRCFDYDPLHRLTDVGATNTPGGYCKRYRYDNSAGVLGSIPSGVAPVNNLGRMVEAETDDCTWPVTAAHQITDEWFSYDPNGNVTDVWEMTPHSGGYYHSSASYWQNGLLDTLNIPGRSLFSIGLNSNGRPISATLGSTTLVSQVTRDAAGRTTLFDYGSSGGNEDTYTYDANTGQMKTYAFTTSAATDSGTLTWNANGTLQKLVIADGFSGTTDSQTCTFSYDDVARLLTDNCGSSLWNQTYSYDQYDNLTKSGNPGTSWNPGYGATNNHITGATYDLNGDLTYDLNNAYAWDMWGKMASARTGTSTAVCGTSGTCVTYDALGNAVEKNVAGTYWEILYSPVGKTAIMTGSSVDTMFLPLPGGSTDVVASADSYINHLDWLGSTRLQADLTGTVRFTAAYTPYGELYASTGSAAANQSFTGDRQDLFSGLYDTPNRELDQSSGSRWLSPDPAGASWNAYSYVTDPNTQTDPTGLQGGCRPWSCGDAAGSPSVESGMGGGNLEFSVLSASQPSGAAQAMAYTAGAISQMGVSDLDSITNSVTGGGFNPDNFYDPTDTMWMVPAINTAWRALSSAFDMSAGCSGECAKEGGILPAQDIVGGSLPMVAGSATITAIDGLESFTGLYTLRFSWGNESGFINTPPAANSIASFNNVFNTNATFVRGVAPTGNAGLRGLTSSLQISRGGNRILFSQYIEDSSGTGMWRISNHWGNQQTTSWFLNDMTGGTFDKTSGLWMFDQPVAAYVRYVDMVPRTY